ncbi:YtkA-like protein [Scopulibacillus darangshiensis]|uniref:YtkA-like protein n=1 Tax=Scopulibacillus darangshiensis TaxID=442528 RepID=A0A4R2P6V9_9BACL|nr:FixH family protein [Scopulibacillus darangshiensis]TCP30602.1 YtkA-like protein [Scopulibacillus darangshiensis]
MKKQMVFIIGLMIFILAGCNNSDSQISHQGNGDDSLAPLKVNILTDKNAFKVNESGKVEIKVTKKEENVDDADEVKFEIWKDGQKNKSRIYKGVHTKEGHYMLKHTFKAPGDYHIIAHVTARGSHTMPVKVLHVSS